MADKDAEKKPDAFDFKDDAIQVLRATQPAAYPPVGCELTWSSESYRLMGPDDPEGWWRHIWAKAVRQFPDCYIQVVDARIDTYQGFIFCWAAFRTAPKALPSS